MLNKREEEVFNCEYANKNISIPHFLEKIGCLPVKKKGNMYLYHSPLRIDKDPSFYVNVSRNIYKDFGDPNSTKNNLGYTLVDLVCHLYGISPKNALIMLKTMSFSSFQPQIEDYSSKLQIIEVKELTHQALISYICDIRKIDISIAKKYCKEVHYMNANRRFFCVGFENNSGGFECRSSIDKRSIAPKDVTLIQTAENNKLLFVFEGFINFLSGFQSHFYYDDNTQDFLILNGVGLINRIEDMIIPYDEIYVVFDNDSGGHLCMAKFFDFKQIKFCVGINQIYEPFNDLNEYLIYYINKGKKLDASVYDEIRDLKYKLL